MSATQEKLKAAEAEWLDPANTHCLFRCIHDCGFGPGSGQLRVYALPLPAGAMGQMHTLPQQVASWLKQLTASGDLWTTTLSAGRTWMYKPNTTALSYNDTPAACHLVATFHCADF